jgi:Ca-activated chloride channel family protein
MLFTTPAPAVGEDAMGTFICMAWMIVSSLLAFADGELACPVRSVEPAGTPFPSGNTSGQQGLPAGDFTIRTKTVLVTIDAVVRNDKGGFVGNLQAEDFIIYDNGVAQQIRLFSREEYPLAIALVVDRSPSIQPYLTQLRSAALLTLQRLKPEDEVALFAFDMFPAKVSDLTEDRRRIARMISQIPGGDGTNIYDSLFEAARYLHAMAIDTRRAIILVSDNVQSVPGNHGHRDTLREALEGGVVIHSIRTLGENPSDTGLGNPSSIARMATETGGTIINASTATDLTGALDAAITNLKQGYVLGFSPSGASEEGSYHRLEVRLEGAQRCPGCRVQARNGYYASAGVSSQPRNDLRAETKAGSRATKRPAAFSAQPVDFEEPVSRKRILYARDQPLELRDIPFAVTTSKVMDDKGMAQIRVDLQIQVSNIPFETVGDRHTGRLRITTFYMDSKGKILGSEWKIMDLRLLEETYMRILQSGIPYSTTIPLKAPVQIIKVVVYDPWSDKLGTRLARFE